MGMLQNKIFTKLNKNKLNAETEFYYIHHIFMKEYGWIPLEEFKKLPMQTVNNLLDQIIKDKEAEKKMVEKGKK